MDQKLILASLERAARTLGPDVVRITYNLGEDWLGNDAIFFRILISDEASQERSLHATTRRASAKVTEEVDPYELGLQPYFDYRSVSEQEELKEAIWA